MADTNDCTLPQAPESLDIKLENISSTALARLIDEVRNDGEVRNDAKGKPRIGNYL